MGFISVSLVATDTTPHFLGPQVTCLSSLVKCLDRLSSRSEQIVVLQVWYLCVEATWHVQSLLLLPPPQAVCTSSGDRSGVLMLLRSFLCVC
jgi:hypothetical protein